MSAATGKAPRRIASLLASATELLYGLGLGERVVAISHECDYPPGATDKPRVTKTRVAASATSREIDEQVRAMAGGGEPLYELDTDRLAELAPDLIVTQAQCDVCAVRYQDVLDAVAAHDGLRGTQVVALNPLRLADILDDILRVGQAAGVADAARHYVASLQERIDRVRDTGKAIAPQSQPRVAALEWIEPPMLAANWMPELITLAGGRVPRDDAGQHSTYATWDDVVNYRPEVVVVMPCGFDLRRTVDEAAVLFDLPGWSDLPAVRDGRVFAVDANAYFNRSGPRIVDSLEILAHLIHPEVFGPPASVPEPRHVWCRLGS